MVYNYLTVIERDYEYPIIHNIKTKTIRYWKCKCKCGNFTTVSEYSLKYGRVMSCGCYARLRSSETHINDLTGQIFGRLMVLRDSNKRWRSSDGMHSAVYWHTKCECGNEIDVLGAHLLSGNVTSCGCFRSQRIIELNRVNLINKCFGQLQVLYENGKNEIGFLWHARCECGNEIDVNASFLTSGKVQSCGCIKSIGEANIQKVLQENNIYFKKEKTFEDLISNKGGKYRYDFYLPEYNRLIEFDGIQHYECSKSEKSWDTKEKFEKTQKRDKLKNEYALSHNILLVRIPYWKRDKITLDMLLGDEYLIQNKKKEEVIFDF